MGRGSTGSPATPINVRAVGTVTPHRPGSLAAGLTAFGVPAGSRIAVMATGASARLATTAIRLAGCEPVPVPDDSSGVRLRSLLQGVVAALAAGDDQAVAIGRLAGDLTDLRFLWQLSSGGFDELTAAAAGTLPAGFVD